MGPDPGDHLLIFAGFRVGVLRHSVCVWIPLVCVGISRPRAEIDGGGKAGGIIRGAGDRILARGGRNSVDSTFAVRGPHHGLPYIGSLTILVWTFVVPYFYIGA